MNIKKFAAGVMAAVMAVSLCACSDGGGEKASSDDPVVFTVGDAAITKSEFMAYVSSYTQNGSYDIDSAKEYAKEDAVNNLASTLVMEKENLTYTDEEKAEQKQQKDDIIKNLGGEDGYKKYLDTLGVTDEFIDSLLAAGHAQEKIFADELSEDAEKQYFNDNYLRAKHILLATMDTSTQEKYDDAKIAEQKALADELLSRAQSGEDFDALVSEYSEDPGSKSQPDGYYFTAGQMVQEFEDTVRSLGMNEIGMCESTYGYHIIKRLPLDDDETLYNEQLETNKTAVQQILLQNAVAEKLPQLMEQYGITVETNQDVYDSITE